MQIKPVITKKQPEYPTEYLFINNPELFKRYIPLRWYKNKVVCTALTAFILAGGTESYSHVPKPIAEKINTNTKQKPTKEKDKKIFKVAPIFVHGNGSGVVGCVVMSPPVFISEDEAIQIISEELEKAKIIIDTANCPSIEFKADAIADECYDKDSKHHLRTKVVIDIDGVDIEHKFSVEYVSVWDFSKFSSEKCDRGSTVETIETKQAAEIFREKLKKNNNNNAVVFYDPIYRDDNDDEMSEEQKLAKSKEQLVAQVSDFINWMKIEGIIK